jgi:hypothetical protein
MKKFVSVLVIIAWSCIIFTSCKKSNDSSNNGNTSSAVSDKTWWGMFTYPGDTTEYYSVHFNADSTMLWNQMLGEYGGKWTLSGNHLSMNFTNGVIITADITGGNKLSAFKVNNTSIINSGELLASPYTQSLDGTKWRGAFYDKIGSDYPMGMEFKSGNQVDITIDGMATETFSYVRSGSGVTIRAKNGSEVWFGLLMSDTTINGTVDKAENKWVMTKQ